MPFQSRIDSTAWPMYCLSYNEVKRSVFDIVNTEGTAAFPEKEFQEILQAELDKINLFTVIKYEDIFRSLQSAANSTTFPPHISGDPIREKQYLLLLERSIDQIATELVNLDKYVRTNCEGFIKLVSKFDRILRSSGSGWFIARLGKEEFCNVSFSSLFILLSLTWSKFRATSSGQSASSDATWRPPESFVRSTAKYWVKPESVARLKADVLKRLPYLIFGSSVKEQEQFLDPTTVVDTAGGDSRMSETQLVTSIYLDNEDGDIYRQRILRKEGSRLVRFRWYGSNEGSPDQDVYIERKVHHESWVEEASSKDRFVIKQKDVFRFMKGSFGIEEHFGKLVRESENAGKSVKPILSMKALAEEVDTFIQQLQLQPFIRTCYYRCAFQLATSNDVRVSLDTQMSLINEFRPHHHPTPPWCRLASDVLAESDVVRFPYAILEVKLADARNPPDWVTDMLVHCGAVRVHKFSKFLHAMAFLHPEGLSMVPHWFADFQHNPQAGQAGEPGAILSPKSILVSASGHAVSERDRRRVERILLSSKSSDDGDFVFGEHRRKQDEAGDDGMDSDEEGVIVLPTGAGGSVQVKDMRSIEPKSIFANERTFLHYCQKAILLLSVAAGLGWATDGASRLASWVKMIVTVVVVGYLVVVYGAFNDRQNVLLSKMAVAKTPAGDRLDIVRGPLLAALLVILASVVSFANTTTST